ncbi:MAG: universal stress protein [Betaproteobacteria bacterium]|nr:universal stress protein [Betaproteobacteria bacterium]
MFAVKAALNGDAHTRLEQLLGDAAIRRGVTARTYVVDGNPVATIAAEADALDADLVVLGARGESFLRHALLGSTAARLLRKSSSRPVLVVKQAPHEAFRSVVVAVDFSSVSLQAIRLARSWAPNADLVLLHAFELPLRGQADIRGRRRAGDPAVRHQRAAKFAASGLHELAAAAGLAAIDYSARIVRGDPAQQIIAMEQEVDADLIVVGKHGSHVSSELLLGSVTKQVLAESQCDVLVICDPRPAPDPSP